MQGTSKIIALISVVATVLISCSKGEETLKVVAVAGKGENELRVPVSVRFSSPCEYWIEYWKDGGKVEKTRIYRCEGSEADATIMFLYPGTTYTFRVVARSGEQTAYSEEESFTTGDLPVDVPKYRVKVTDTSRQIPGLLMQSSAGNPGFVTFCDTDGMILWYERFDEAVRQATFDPRTGTILVNLGFRFDPNGNFQRIADKTVMLDLFGNRLFEKKAGEGYLDYPHHEIVRMDDGNILALHNSTQEFDLTSLGGEPRTDVYGEGISIFSPEGNVVWAWNCFGTLNPLMDKTVNPVKNATDLMHANSVCWDSEDNLYISYNKLNEIWKILRQDGSVLYRAACDTDGIHSLVSLAPDKLLCLDNGKNAGQSRAVIYNIDPSTGTPVTQYSVAFPREYCSINRSNVVYRPDMDLLIFSSTVRLAAVFTDLEGNMLRVIERNEISYRAYYYDSIEY
ncbi:MAG: aryl-sulfate sulfotransferase [Bacteroidales bacterium]|nr:aryl-sulfate sulfotransferase [Bacteroidales bacterium]